MIVVGLSVWFDCVRVEQRDFSLKVNECDVLLLLLFGKTVE